MKILDLRPWYERSLLRWWRRRRPMAQPDPWSRLCGGLPALRAARRRPAPGRPFVVSVGNLSLGGSGKTPVVGKLAQDLASGGMKVGVLTRGYGSGLRSPVLVEGDCQGCGDEARLLAGRSGAHVVVVQAAHRGEGFAYLAARFPDLDCVLLDDGFQTGGLGRDLDVLILNAWTSDPHGVCIPLAGPVLPLGPWREPPGAARRADVWLLESTGPLPDRGGEGPLVAAFSRISRLADGQGRAAAPREAGSWAAVSGIAHPEKFEEAAAGVIGHEPVLAVRCRDHDRYAARTLRAIDRAMGEAGADSLVTTAKDWVKLAGRIPGRRRVFVLEQEVRWSQRNALPDLVRERMRGQAEGQGL